MLPRLATNDISHRCLAHPKPGGKWASAILRMSELMVGANEADIIVGQHREMMSNAAPESCSTPPFIHLLHVLSMRPRMQMIRVATRRVVARVQDIQIVRDTAVCQKIGNAMRQPILAIDRWMPIAIPMAIPLPLPAVVWTTTVNLRPKICNLFWGKMEVHLSLLYSGATRPGAVTSRAISLPSITDQRGVL